MVDVLEQLLDCKVSEWHTLTEIRLNDQGITELPEEVSNWTSAPMIDLSGNKLENLPVGVSNWTSAWCIHFKNNKLKSLPKEVSNWTYIRYISLEGNKILFVDDFLCDKCFNNFLYTPDKYFSRENKTKILTIYAVKIQRQFRLHLIRRKMAARKIQQFYKNYYYRPGGNYSKRIEKKYSPNFGS